MAVKTSELRNGLSRVEVTRKLVDLNRVPVPTKSELLFHETDIGWPQLAYVFFLLQTVPVEHYLSSQFEKSDEYKIATNKIPHTTDSGTEWAQFEYTLRTAREKFFKETTENANLNSPFIHLTGPLLYLAEHQLQFLEHIPQPYETPVMR